MIRKIALLQLFLSTIGIAQFAPSGMNTIEDLHLLAREVRSNQRVLFVMFAPSSEDVDQIIEARLANKASVHLAYLTNGDGIPDGEGMPYPNQTAARWRGRAYELARSTASGHTFLNLPYIDAAASVERVRVDWPADSVRSKWRDLVQTQKPDAVIISGLERFGKDHPIVTALLSDISSATRQALRSRGWVPLQIACAVGFRSGDSPTTKTNLSEHVRSIYGPHLLPERTIRAYRVFDWKRASFGAALTRKKMYPQRRVPDRLSPIDSAMQIFARRLLGLRSVPAPDERDTYLEPLVQIMQQIDLGIAQAPLNADEERRFLLDWKLSLERIRGILLGVRVSWRLSEHILTDRQLTYLTIDSISGLDPEGRTEIFFPEVRNGWVVNEQGSNHLPYVQGQAFRLLSSENITYDLPRDVFGLTRPVYQAPSYFFVVHQGTVAKKSFAFRVDLDITGAPRFSCDVRTPVVRAVDGEEVVFRLANHSRDGVADSIYVSGGLVRSAKRGFRLSSKDSEHQDTVRLQWTDAPAGLYLVNLLIEGEPIANFLARRFAVTATRGREVALIGDAHTSMLYPALKRLGYRVRMVPAVGAGLGAYKTILVDEWIHKSGMAGPEMWSNVKSSAEAGAHVLLFAQQGDVLNSSGLFPSVTFTPAFDADTSYSIAMTDSADVLLGPNDLSNGTWADWIYRVASNDIEVPAGMARVHARFEDTERPVIFSVPVGEGTITYIDLNLTPQWANVLPASYALLANLVENAGSLGDEQ